MAKSRCGSGRHFRINTAQGRYFSGGTRQGNTRSARVEGAKSLANLVDSTTSGVLAGEVKEISDVERGSVGIVAEEPSKNVWDCSQVETSWRRET